MNDPLKKIVSVWGGATIPFPELNGLDGHIYVREGIEARAIIILYDIDEKWSQNLDVLVPVNDMEKMYYLESLFKAPVILLVSYADKQAWVKVLDVYMMATKNSGKKRADLTTDGNVFIPKESFTELPGEK